MAPDRFGDSGGWGTVVSCCHTIRILAATRVNEQLWMGAADSVGVFFGWAIVGRIEGSGHEQESESKKAGDGGGSGNSQPQG
jgi:hypothetical protein